VGVSKEVTREHIHAPSATGAIAGVPDAPDLSHCGREPVRYSPEYQCLCHEATHGHYS